MKNLFNTFFILANLFIINALSAQTIDGIDLKSIEAMVNDKEGVYYYPELVKKFQKNDITLKKIDFLMLYYGFIFQKEYNPYKHYALEDSLGSLTNQKKGTEALALANKLLKINPVSLSGYVEKAYTLKALRQDQESANFLNKYNNLIGAVEASGIGSSYENPIVLITPKDAEVIVMRYKLRKVSKSINGQNDRYYDVYLVQNEQGKQYPIYFDITIPYTIGMKKLDKPND